MKKDKRKKQGSGIGDQGSVTNARKLRELQRNLDNSQSFKDNTHSFQTTTPVPCSLFPVPYSLAFLFPFTILGTVFALNGIYPFGDRQILIFDFFQQFYPFLSDLWHKLREGTVSTWSWTAGLGHDYISQIAYYLASPLNLFALILPHAWLREVLTVILLIKIGCAGLFTAMFLRYAFKQNGIALPVFSTMYALCAFTLGYFYNVLWLDSFAMLPLIMLGFLALLNEGKWKLFTITLAVSVFANFYISFFICLFIAITFFSQCIIQKYNKREFLSKLGKTAGYSALAIGMTTALLLPSWFSLQNTSAVEGGFPTAPVLYTSFFDVLGNFIAFTPPTFLKGLPNIYSGMICIMLASLFFYSPKISRREKMVFGSILFFLLLGCNFNIFDYIIHGFHQTRNVPFRFSFLLSFVLVYIAFRGFKLLDDNNRIGLMVMGISASIILLSAVFGSQETAAIIGSTILCIVYLLLFFLWKKTGKTKQLIRTILFIVIFIEISVSSFIAIKSSPLTKRDDYPINYKQIQTLLDQRQSNDSFYRTDIAYGLTSNDPHLYNYNGLAFFSSMLNKDIAKFMTGLGIRINEVNLTYIETTPLTDAFINLRYMMAPDNHTYSNKHWRIAGKSDHFVLLENRFYLPLGFMVNENLTTYEHLDNNPFLSQNNFFHKATGLDGNLFTTTNITNNKPDDISVEHDMKTWNYQMPSDGMLYVHCSDNKNNLFIAVINHDFDSRFLLPCFSLAQAGTFAQDDIVSFTAGSNAIINVSFLDYQLFEQGYKQLARSQLILTDFSNTNVKGHVSVLEDGLLYTSIPGKNWNVYVNGVKSDIILIDNAMAAVRLSKGYHEVEFRYFNPSFAVGIAISLVSLGVFVFLVVRGRFTQRRKSAKKS